MPAEVNAGAAAFFLLLFSLVVDEEIDREISEVVCSRCQSERFS